MASTVKQLFNQLPAFKPFSFLKSVDADEYTVFKKLKSPIMIR
jgi:hypothetical protein